MEEQKQHGQGVIKTDGVRRTTADLKGSLIYLIWTTRAAAVTRSSAKEEKKKK